MKRSPQSVNAKRASKQKKSKARPLPKGGKIALEIRVKGDEMIIKGKRMSRLTSHGFGLFLENYTPDEVGITKEAQGALLQQRYISGLQPIEFFDHNVIGICSGRFPIKEASVHGEVARGLIKRFTIIS